ncbi:hypothetical protein F5I97DRAFT_1805072 [Phlebopus sp. FC_14]|nr:hypothetical protein F5I97DRAFT_1805072 [Phlebopus sp. FC_14]
MTSSSHDDPVLSSSPTSVRGISPLRRRGDRESLHQADSVDPNIRPRMSPTLVRSFDPNDPDARERQRTMDVDMALHLSRARRETIVSPTSPYEPPGRLEPEQPFSPLSVSEQHGMEFARGEIIHAPDEEPVNGMSDEAIHSPTPIHLGLPQLSPAQDPSLAATVGTQYPEDAANSLSGLPTYQATPSRSVFDFSVLEIFATEEKANLGLISPRHSAFRLRQPTPPSKPGEPSVMPSGSPCAEVSGDSMPVPPRQGTRQRKISQSTPVPRSSRKGIRGKMALFENQANETGSGFPSRLIPNGNLSAIPSSENVAAPHRQYTSPSLGVMDGIMSPGHDRPYRFSFYSNALSATIHARSLSELPAEGQSFVDLFSGVPCPAAKQDGKGGPTSTATPVPVPRDRTSFSFSSGRGTPNFTSGNQTNMFFQRTWDKQGMDPGRPDPNGDENGGDFEARTWWLDVQSPTEEEMKVLSKVFSIHPLTTEDIQMEEAREKIELFRNYYLVCFRSFDQDPYSPTHLEPLNMYIIVFREGILSFHFRPTPHPQNVRRRIKQLRDYINVTSDWISYALIDDITDAFGPLIQSIEYEVDSIDELVLILKEAEQSDMLRRIGTCRKKVMGLLRLMGNKADVVKGLAKRCNENWRVAPTSDIGLYLSDIQDHLITMTQNLNHYEKILSRSHSNYLAQISIDMTEANNQINDVLSKLTALGTVLIPMNLITGLWGMNVHVPGQDIAVTSFHTALLALFYDL